MITTKKGDGGMSEYFGKRVSKGGKLLDVVGTLDELQAVLGLVKLEKLQKDIYEIMGNLEKDSRDKILENRVGEMEKEINKIEEKIKIENKFVIFKKKKALKLNWVRTIARRAERAVVSLESGKEKLDKNILIYLNRLSDFIYLLALKEEKR